MGHCKLTRTVGAYICSFVFKFNCVCVTLAATVFFSYFFCSTKTESGVKRTYFKGKRSFVLTVKDKVVRKNMVSGS